MEYRLSVRARTDIADIYFYGRQRWNERLADEYYLGLIQAFEAIVEFPKSSPSRGGFEAEVRIRVYRSHLIVFEIQQEAIVILRIVHGRYDWQSDF